MCTPHHVHTEFMKMMTECATRTTPQCMHAYREQANLPAGCGNSRNRLIHLTRTEQRLEVIMAVTTMSEPLDRMCMALSINKPTPPVEPASSSSTDSKYFNKERPAPALYGWWVSGKQVVHVLTL